MKELTVYKLDENGELVWQYPAIELARDERSIRLEAFFNRDDLDLGFTVFAHGDRFVEHYFCDRWYNVFTVHEGDSEQLKGWYCNICRPARLGESAVECEDLALDVWVTPDGEALVLDEDEFAALAISDEERAKSLKAMEELLQLARSGSLPL